MTTAADWAKKKLGYTFTDPDLLQRALTHKSKAALNNERLEFLGDAVLGLVIAEALHSLKPDAHEGYLSRLRSTLVRSETLADIATDLGLGDLLRLGAGESRSGGHQRRSLMADALEAVFGAAYLDGGFAAAEALIRQLYADRLAHLPAEEELKDPKTLLQEALQAAGHELPAYTVVDESGPPHDRRFRVECRVKAHDLRQDAIAGSRRKAEQKAAARILALLEESD